MSDDLAHHLATKPTRGSEALWVGALSRWGQRVLVRVAVAVARRAHAVWSASNADDPIWTTTFRARTELGAALDAASRWLNGDADVTAVLNAALNAERVVERARAYANEASGSRALCEARERCVAAGEAVVLAARVAAWTPDVVRGLDAAEAEAAVAAGPAREVVSAWQSAQAALGCEWAVLADAVRVELASEETR